MTTVHTLQQLDEFLDATDKAPTDDLRRSAWNSLQVDHGMFGGYPDKLAVMDPRSDEYVKTVDAFMRFLHGGDYSLASEGFDYDLAPLLKIGFPHSSRSPATVGAYLISYGFVIRAMNLPVPAKILEIGAGLGSLSIHLARMGYDLTAVDVNKNFADHVAKVCEGSPGKVRTIASDMNALDLPQEFDAVLFYESFHHSYDHKKTIAKALEFLKLDGMLVLAAEPVLPAQRDVLPYPWGPRLDGETLRAIRRFGWMELGFTEAYLYELLMEHGLAFRRISSAETHWADLIIANRVPAMAAGEALDCSLGAPGVLMLATGWSAPEPFGTWSKEPLVKMMFDLSHASFARGAELTFDVLPFLPAMLPSQRVDVRVGGRVLAEWRFEHAEMAQGWRAVPRKVRVGPKDRDASGRIVLEFAIERPCSPLESGVSTDPRKLGFAVTRVSAAAA